MKLQMPTGALSPRRGVAAVELALILPLFVLLFVFAVDFGRVFYVRFIVINAARCGALYGSKSPACAQDLAGIKQRAAAEAQDLDAALLQIASLTGTDEAGNPYVDVTVNYPFAMITSYLVAKNWNVAARMRMSVVPALPTTN